MSKYPSDILHVSFSSGPWLESLQCLISLSSPLSFQLSRHQWEGPHLKTTGTQTTKCALDWKMLFPAHKPSGEFQGKNDFLFRNLLCLCGRKLVSTNFSLVDAHLEPPAAEEHGSGRADGWMHCGWWKSSLPVHILLEEFAYWGH